MRHSQLTTAKAIIVVGCFVCIAVEISGEGSILSSMILPIDIMSQIEVLFAVGKPKALLFLCVL